MIGIIKDIGAVAGALVTVIGLATLIILRFAKIINKAVEPINKSLDDVKQLMHDMGLAVKQNNDATCAALKYSISRAHREYMTNGRITRYALQCVLDMHAQYRNLGGNGLIEGLIDELKTLPHEM